MADLPVGTVTLLFTDIEGSTRLLRELGDRYADALEDQRRLLRAAFERRAGREVDTQGDAFFVAFSRAADAVAAVVEAQRALASHPWPDGAELRVRMGLHTGEPTPSGDGYIGLDLHRAARICAAGHGGQVLLSDAVQVLAGHTLPDGIGLRDLGEHRLKDLQYPERIFQLVIAGLPSDFPPLRTPDARSHTLPLQVTALLGREGEAANAREWLLREDLRLLTLTGPGGTGKTRLSLQVAAELVDDFTDGVFFVDLAPISDPGLVASTIAQTLGLRDVGGQPVLDRLKEFLREKQLLLLLDNFEQILPAAPVVSELLGASPGLKVLVTSREPLRLRGEREYAVPPLALPEHGRQPSVAALSQYAAVALFIERAAAIRADFSVTDENASAVAEICARLDGLPLAIELAAARIRLLSPQAMLSRLERRLPLLTGGARDLPARQQTLRGTIGWSHDLLNDPERRLFRRLSVFVGGWSLEGADAVCRLDEADVDPLDGLGSLVSKSLVKQGEDSNGDPRFSMLETIREYAREQLDAHAELPAVQQRHFRFCLRLAKSGDAKLRSAEQGEWLARLEHEHGNCRAALEWSRTATIEQEAALELAVELSWFWFLHGHFGEGRRWLESFLTEGRAAAAPTRLRAKALNGAGNLAWAQGDFEQAELLHEEALALFRESGDNRGVALALGRLGHIPQSRGDYQRAAELFEESLALFREVGDAWGVPSALYWIGSVAHAQGDIPRAKALHEEGLSLYRNTGDRRGMAYQLRGLGHVAHSQGDTSAAMVLLQESVNLFMALGDKLGAAWSLYSLGDTALARGDLRAADLFFRDGLGLNRQTGNKRGAAECLEGMGRVAVPLGALQRAARLFAASTVLHEATGTPVGARDRSDVDHALNAVRAGLGDEVFRSRWDEGRAMTMEQAVAYALAES